MCRDRREKRSSGNRYLVGQDFRGIGKRKSDRAPGHRNPSQRNQQAGDLALIRRGCYRS